MEKDKIETLLLLKETKSITKAADHLGIAQPTLSKMLKVIETKLQTKIFKRLPRSIELTKEGEIYLKNFKSILEILEKAQREVQSLYDTLEEDFLIGVHPIIGKYILPKIEKSIEKNTSIHLNYRFKNSREATKDVLEGKIDLAIVADAQKYPDLIIRDLWREQIVLYSRDGKKKDLILYNSNMIFSFKILKEISFKRKKEVNDYNVLYSILKRTNSMGILPHPLAESEKKLKVIKKFPPGIKVSLIYRSDIERTRSFSKLVSIIRDHSKNF